LDLRERELRAHAPLGMGGVAIAKKRSHHGPPDLERLREEADFMPVAPAAGRFPAGAGFAAGPTVGFAVGFAVRFVARFPARFTPASDAACAAAAPPVAAWAICWKLLCNSSHHARGL